jgi:hypothetical protein
MSHAVEHIHKLKSAESIDVLSRGLREKLVVVCTVNDELKVYDLSFYGELKKDRIILSSKRWSELKNKTCAFSMKVNTQVYFFKTKVLADENEIYLKTDFEIFELKRRKDIRYKVPYEWPQNAAIIIGSKKDKKMAANILDLSNTGIKLQLLAQIPEVKIGQKIAFTIKIHRRSIAYLNGVVRHSRRVKNQLPVIGVEIEVATELLKDKLNNICSDIIRFGMLSRKKHKQSL